MMLKILVLKIPKNVLKILVLKNNPTFYAFNSMVFKSYL